MKIKQPQLVTRESLQQMLDAADDMKKAHIVGRALMVLFARQTEAEQHSLSTLSENGIGFAGCDSVGGSLTAKSYARRRTLEGWQVEKWTRKGKNGFARLCKYASQLNEIAMIKQQYQKPQQQLQLED